MHKNNADFLLHDANAVYLELVWSDHHFEVTTTSLVGYLLKA